MDGLFTDQYHFADGLTIESYQNLASKPNVKQGTMIVPGWVIIVMNTKGTLTADVRIRQAALAAISPSDMLAAAFGPPSVWTLEGSIYPKGTELYIADAPGHNAHDPAKATALLKAAGYKGQPFRIFATAQYDYMFKIAQVAEVNLTEAGFKLDLQVMDWATLLQRRNDAGIWEAFVTSSPIFPDPTLFSPFNRNYAGWWDTPSIQAAVQAFTSTPDNTTRLAAWTKMHALVYNEVPSLLAGYCQLLYGISTKLENFTPAQPPPFWNVRLNAWH